MRGLIAAGSRRRSSGGSGGGGTGGEFLNFDFDTSEGQAFTHSLSGWEASAHQHAWLTSPTRLGTGHSERFEVHNNTSTDIFGSTMRSLMACVNTNEGGTTVGAVVGYPEVYWAWSSFLPTSTAGNANATVVAGFSQTTVPNYEHLFEIHDRNGGSPSIGEVAPHAVMVRSGQLQYRERCGQWTWNGSGYNSPGWNTTNPGTNGSNDQIPIPIVKASGTNATMLMDAWLDIIVHYRFRTDSTGLIEIWAREAGQSFSTSPNLSLPGPTHRVIIQQNGATVSSADLDSVNSLTGMYMETGLYTGSSGWNDGSNGAHVHIVDEMRRYGTLAEAKANWG